MERNKIIRFTVIGIILLVAVVFSVKTIIHALHYESTDNAQVETKTTPVLARVAGYIDSINVDDYDSVIQGQTLVTIEKSEYEIAVEQAQADLFQAEADLQNAQAAYVTAQQNVRVAGSSREVSQARIDKAKEDLTRDQNLFKDQSITQKQLDDSKSNYEVNVKTVNLEMQRTKYAETSLTTAEAQVKRAQAVIKVKQAALDNAKLRLSYTLIAAPETGRIGKSAVQAGQFIQAGQPLFTIVNNDDFWIVANFKETQIENMHEGQAVDISLDAYPDKKITGKIQSLSEATGARFSLLPPDNASGNFVKITQRVPVRISIDGLDSLRSLLKAGISAEIEVKVK
ncbi:MAG TPA: HlyD family secretion protein [Chitinophagales bacterium]